MLYSPRVRPTSTYVLPISPAEIRTQKQFAALQVSGARRSIGTRDSFVHGFQAP